MVTRRQFGYWLRDRIAAIKPDLKVELNFSESLLETWAVREAFLFFCLIVDPDAPTWPAWLGYQNSLTGKNYKAAKRNAGAYLKFLSTCDDVISYAAIERVANAPSKPRGSGGSRLWERAKRFLEITKSSQWTGEEALSLVEEVFNPDVWIGNDTADPDTARLDMLLVRTKAQEILREFADRDATPERQLAHLANRLRYQVATREPFVADSTADLRVSTLWGAKGVTAEHVYILGVCDEAIPGERREEYPGTDLEYCEEQRRLFYVSITRSRKTMVLSRATGIGRGQAASLGLSVVSSNPYWAELRMSRFLRDIMPYLPPSTHGEDRVGYW
jgi:hypothetical protein